VPILNRLTKNLRTLGAWADREGVTCWRLYDADMPEFAAAVDLYREEPSGEVWAHVQEYAPPASIDPDKAERRLEWLQTAVSSALGIPSGRVVTKTRRRQTGGSQYEKQALRGRYLEVREGDARFLVNLTDYLDTGLFLDHRPLRRRIAALAGGRRFLNLFSYTGTATVAAARGGAATTTSVDLSPGYLDWAGRNLTLNGFVEGAHRLVRADVTTWLGRELDRYDLIHLDPPTFSNSKRMEGWLDVDRDHPGLIRKAAALLAPGGILLFSTHLRKFKLREGELGGLSVEDVGPATLDPDFRRNPRIHHAWEIRAGAE
jgi:23S rRNA (guanine2445-N2)-methyltransferase / 23S rRNA (guanine2069-N7)-methyltransferase